MIGLWCGSQIAADHPLDGVLENLGWFGKRFQSDLKADALVFQFKPGVLVPLEPAIFPIRLLIRLAPLGQTKVARAVFPHLQRILLAHDTTAMLTLRMIEGEETTAMVYDKQPIADYFRRIDEKEIAGMMVIDGDDRRYFFRLRKVDRPTYEISG